MPFALSLLLETKLPCGIQRSDIAVVGNLLVIVHKFLLGQRQAEVMVPDKSLLRTSSETFHSRLEELEGFKICHLRKYIYPTLEQTAGRPHFLSLIKSTSPLKLFCFSGWDE